MKSKLGRIMFLVIFLNIIKIAKCENDTQKKVDEKKIDWKKPDSNKETVKKIELNELILSKNNKIEKEFDAKSNLNFVLSAEKDLELLKNSYLYLIIEGQSLNSVAIYFSEENNNPDEINNSANCIGLEVAICQFSYKNVVSLIEKSIKVYFKISPNFKSKSNNKIKVGVFIDQKLKLKKNTNYFYNIFGGKSLKVEFDYKYNPIHKKLKFLAESLEHHQKYIRLNGSLNSNYMVKNLNNLTDKIIASTLYENTLKNCKENCNFDVIINYKNIRKMKIYFNEVSELEKLSDDFTYDEVELNSEKLYEYNNNYEFNNGSSLVISMIPIKGKIDLFANIETFPTEIDKYYWKEKGNLAKKIIIPFEEIELLKAKNKKICIKVKGETEGKYIIKTNVMYNNNYGELHSGIKEQGFVPYEKLVQYRYNFDIIETEQSNLKVNFEIKTGDADIYLKECGNVDDCSINYKELEKLKKVTSTNNIKDINISSKCEKKKRIDAFEVNSCIYIIGLVGKSNNGAIFEIGINNEKKHNLVLINHPNNIKLHANETKYFVFNNLNLSIKDSLSFNFENNYGSYVIYISDLEKYPSKTNYTNKLEINENNNQYFSSIPIKKNSKKNIFYITVQAKTNCSLTMSTKIKSIKTSLIKYSLVAGKTTNGSLNKQNNFNLYSFNVNLDDTKSNKLLIHLNSIKGEFGIAIRNDNIAPSMSQGFWTTSENYIEINNTDPYFKFKGEYTIGVFLKNTNSSIDDNFDYHLTVNYLGNEYILKHAILKEGNINKQFNNYIIEVHNEVNNILILRSLLMQSYELYIRFRNSKKDYDYVLKNTELGVNIEKDILNSFCKNEFSNKKYCYIDIAIKGANGTKFGIMYNYNDKPFILEKKIINYLPIPPKGKYIDVIYNIQAKEEFEANINSNSYDLSIYPLIQNSNSDNDPDFNYTIPDKKNYDDKKILKENLMYHIFYDEWEKNENLLYLRIYNNINENAKYDFNTHFTVQCSDTIKQLHLKKSQSDYIDSNNLVYYLIENTNEIGEIFVSVETHKGSELELFISKGSDKRPPNNNYIKKSSGFSSTFLKLNNNEVDGKFSGKYVIGIKSSALSLINIYWSNKSFNFIDINFNESKQFHIEKNMPLLVEFYNLKSDNDDIMIYFNGFGADISAYTIMIDNKQFKEGNVPSEEKSIWQSNIVHGSNLGRLVIKNKDKNYCNHCKYLILFKTTKKQTKLRVLVEKQSISGTLLRTGQKFIDILEKNNHKLLLFNNPDDNFFDLEVKILSGFVDFKVKCGIFSDDEIKNIDINKNLKNITLNFNETGLIHNYLRVDTKKLPCLTNNSTYSILALNKLDKLDSSYIIDIFKEGSKRLIEPGVENINLFKFKETKEYIFNPVKTSGKNKFTIRFTINSFEYFENDLELDYVYKKLENMVNLYYITGNNEILFQPDYKYAYENNLYMEYSIRENNNSQILIRMKNLIEADITTLLGLYVSNYNLLSVNQNYVGFNLNNDSSFKEILVNHSNKLNVKIESCLGSGYISHFQNDDDIDLKNNENFTKSKNITANNNLDYNLKVKHNRIFTKITNKKGVNQFYYNIQFQHPDSFIKNQRLELKLENKKVRIDTENGKIHLESLKLSDKLGFKHRYQVIYKLYLSKNLGVINYMKGCGIYLLDRAFPNSKYYYNEKILEYEGNDGDQTTNLSFELDKLEKQTLYHGYVVAYLQIYPKKIGYIVPLLEKKLVYDRFQIETSQYNFSMALVGSTIIIFFFFIVFIYFLSVYFNSKIKMFSGMQNIADFDDENFNKQVLGFYEEERLNPLEDNEDTLDMNDDNDVELREVNKTEDIEDIENEVEEIKE